MIKVFLTPLYQEEVYEQITEMRKIMITQLVIYWIRSTFQSIIN